MTTASSEIETGSTGAFALFRGYDERARALAGGNEAPAPTAAWQAIAFRAGTARMLAPLDAVAAVTDPPVITPVPGSRDWLLGLAGHADRIMAVTDLAAYAGWAGCSGDQRARVLVIDHDGALFGLMVDEVFGFTTVSDDAGCRALSETGRLRACTGQACVVDGEALAILDIDALFAEPRFMHAGGDCAHRDAGGQQ